jgi:hypothetical protein
MSTKPASVIVPQPRAVRGSFLLIAAALVVTALAGGFMAGRASRGAAPAIQAPAALAPAGHLDRGAYRGPVTGTGPDLAQVASDPLLAYQGPVTGTGPDLQRIGEDGR